MILFIGIAVVASLMPGHYLREYRRHTTARQHYWMCILYSVPTLLCGAFAVFLYFFVIPAALWAVLTVTSFRRRWQYGPLR